LRCSEFGVGDVEQARLHERQSVDDGFGGADVEVFGSAVGEEFVDPRSFGSDIWGGIGPR
jgi:hypothetical protein